MVSKTEISIDNAILADLKSRLVNTRWPHEVDNDKWEVGTNKSYLQALCRYWETEFDWKKREEELNRFSHFKTVIDQSELHFIHEKGKGLNATPLLLIHGYPDSFVRFLKILPLLTAPDENGNSFDVIVPSIPGYGFSGKPDKPGMDSKAIAALFAELVTKELGYDKFIAHGGDWGGSISEQLALYHPKHLIGVHLTDLPFGHTLEEPEEPSTDEKKFFQEIQQWQQTEGAYSMIQSTKPQSLAYGLNDSPAGLAGWLIEKFYAWSDNSGDLDSVFSKDELLTNLTIYWGTQTIDSAIRIYQEEIQAIMAAKYNPLIKLNPFDKTGQKASVPAGFSFFPKDISHAPKELVERFYNITYWNKLSKGGHFAAMEQPQLLNEELRKFAGLLNWRR